MQQKNMLLVLVLVLMSAAAVSVALFGQQTDPLAGPVGTDRPIIEAELQVYQNPVHGYSLSHYAFLPMREYSADYVEFGTAGEIAVRVLEVAGVPGQTLEEGVAAELAQLCAADGPSGSFVCTGVQNSQPFTTTAGETGYSLYLTGEYTNFYDGSVTRSEKGPYFVLPLASSAMFSKVLVIHPPLNADAAAVDAGMLREVAESVVVTAALPVVDTTPLEAYLAEHLAELSSVKEVLGGHFYITDLVAANGSGTVSYEDGHNAYVADFTYLINTVDGTVTVENFTVRE